MMNVVRAKLHRIRVTDPNLNYHGSITIWNKQSGARISTYVIYGEPGSKGCVLNGAAARTCQQGDEVIICSAEYIKPSELHDLEPMILTCLPDNTVDQALKYDVFRSEQRAYDFRMIDPETEEIGDWHTYPNIDIVTTRKCLKEGGRPETEIESFEQTYPMH